MNKEINRPNDIFVNTILNPGANGRDLVLGGVNSLNTQFLSPEEYKETNFVKKLFTDKDGNFDNELFYKVYNAAAQKYEEVTSIQLLSDLEKYAEYDDESMYAPIFGTRKDDVFTISKVKNPFKSSLSLTHLNVADESKYSQRELAQQSNIFDTETGKYLDYTAEDLGLFKGLFHKPIAYAKYEEDVEEFDPNIGRVVKHRKGEYKLNPEGNFYTETVTDQEGYNKEFVALSDILFKENEWINKINVFESDDKHKSIGGVIMNTALHIVPYLFLGEAWGAFAAASIMMLQLPTLAKAVEGLIVSDGETQFTKKMNLFENYMRRFDLSMSDEAQLKLFSAEMIGHTISDIFGQLYQMRAAAGLSKYAKKDWTKAQKEAVARFNRDYSMRLAEAQSNNILANKSATELFKQMAEQAPEIQKLIKSTQRLSKNLSIGYMAITSATDVYEDAVNGGYDRRVAGVAALSSILGQYLFMSNNKLGDWFLDTAVGYNEVASRSVISKALKPLVKEVDDAIAALPKNATSTEKLTVIRKGLNKAQSGWNKVVNLIMEGSEDFWGKAGIEAIEEVTEEAVFDLTKGIVDGLTYLGIGGERNQSASFNTIENVFSKEGAARYLQSALGGFLGGGLFHVQQTHIEPWITGKSVDKQTQKDIIWLLQNGHYDAVKKGVKRLAKTDPNVSGTAWQVGDQIIRGSSTQEGITRGQVLSNVVGSYVDYLQSILVSKNIDHMTQDQLFEKAMRDAQVRSFLEDTGISNFIVSDFKDFSQKIVELQTLIDELGDDESKAEKKRALVSEQKELIDQVQNILDGKATQEYVQMALAYATPDIHKNLAPISKYQWTESIYGQKYSTLPPTGVGLTKAKVDAEYQKFVEETDKKTYMRLMLKAFNHIDGMTSAPIKLYIENYFNTRMKSLRGVFSTARIDVGIQNDRYYNLLKRIHKRLSTEKGSGLSLDDIILASADDVYEYILKPYSERYADNVSTIAELLGVSIEDYLKLLAEAIASTLSMLPVENWNEAAVMTAITETHEDHAQTLINKIKENLGVDTITSDMVANWLTAHGFVIDTTTDLSTIDPRALITVVTRPVLTDIVENFSELTLSKYITSEEILDQEVINFLKDKILMVLNSAPFKEALEIKLYRSNWFDDAQAYQITISPNAWNKLIDVLTTGLDNNQTIDQIVENIITDGFLDFLLKENTELADVLEETPEHLEELKNILATWIRSADSTGLYEQSITKESRFNPLFDVLRLTDFELTDGQSMTVFNLIQEESNNLRRITDIDEFLKMPDAIERIDSAIAVIKTVRAVVAAMTESDLQFGESAFGYNAQLQVAKKTVKGLEGNFETITMELAVALNQDLDLLEQKLLFVKLLSAKNTDSKKEDDLKAQIRFSELIIEEIKSKASELKFNDISIFTDDELLKLNDTTVPLQVRLGRLEHSAHLQLKKILKTMKVEDFAKELFVKLGIDRKALLDKAMVSAGISKETTALTQFDVLNYFAAILGADMNGFLYLYNLKLGDANYDKVPFFVQELAAKLAYSFLSDEIGLHDALVDALYEGMPDAVFPMKTSRYFFIDGVTGAGKTTVAAMLSLMGQDLNESVGVIGPNKNQAEKLNVSLGKPPKSKVWSKKDLFNLFLTSEAYLELKNNLAGSELTLMSQVDDGDSQWWLLNVDWLTNDKFKSTIKLPKLLIIDEATHFTSIELLILDYIAKKKGVKILALGDSLQNGADVLKSPDSNISDDVFRWSSPKIRLSNRPANINKKETIDTLSATIQEYVDVRKTEGSAAAKGVISNRIAKVPTVLKYWEDSNELLGDKLVDTITVEDLNRLARAAKARGGKVGIITELDASGNPVPDSKGFNILNVIEASELTKDDYVLYSPDNIHPNAAQGAEQDYVVVNLENKHISDSVSPEDNKALIKVYTMLTRSLHGSILKVPKNIKTLLRLTPQITMRPGPYRMPGLEQRQALHQIKQTEITQILDGWAPEAPAAPKPTSAKPAAGGAAPVPTPAASSTSTLYPVVEAAHLPVGKVSMPSEKAPAAPKVTGTAHEVEGISSYTFYTHPGLTFDRVSGTYINDGSTQFNIGSLIPKGATLTEKQVRGFTKLKNILSVYPNDFAGRLGKFNYDENNEIADFVRGVFNLDPSLDDETVISLLLENLQLDTNDYIVAKAYDQNKDYPIFKQGFDDAKTLSHGEPLIMPAKKVSITIGGITKTSYITTGAFPRPHESDSAFDKYCQKVKDDITRVGEIVYATDYSFKPLGTKAGRLLASEESLSLRQLLEYGVNIKQVGLITSDGIPKTSKFKFIEFAKQYLPNAEKFCLKGTNFTKAGYYYAIIGFDGTTPDATSDHLVFLTLDQVKLLDAMKVVSDSSKDLEAKLSILHEYSYSLIVLNIFKQKDLFKSDKQTIIELYFQELRDYLSNINTKGYYTEQIKLLDGILTTKNFSEANIKAKIEASTGLCAFFLSRFSNINEDKIEILGPDRTSIYISDFKISKTLYKNVRPTALANDNGVCPVSEEYVLDNLLLSGLYYEPARLFIPQEVLDKSVLLDSATPEPVVAPEPESKPEPEVITDPDLSEENRQQILADLESRFPGISKHLQNVSLQKHDEELYLYDPELKEWGTEGLNMSVESFILSVQSETETQVEAFKEGIRNIITRGLLELQTIGLPKEEVMQIMSNLDALNVVVSKYNLNAPMSILISITDSFGNTKSKILNDKVEVEDVKDVAHNFIGFPTEEEIKARLLIPQVDEDEISENVQMNTTEQQAEIREALSEKFEDMDIDDLSPYEDMIDLIVKYGNPDMDLFPDDFLTPDGKMKLSAQYLAASPNLQSKLNENNDIMCEV